MKNQLSKYPYVNNAIKKLNDLIKGILGDNYFGMYIHGSLALGDFDTNTSDIDFMVVVNNQLSQNDFLKLKQMHENFRNSDSYWSNRFEGSYVEFSWLREYLPPALTRPYCNNDEFKLELYGYEWTLELFILREFGICIEGEDLKQFIPQISDEVLKEATLKLLRISWLPLTESDYIFKPDYPTYAIQTMCRALYMFKFGKIVSKEVARKWACSNIDQKFNGLIANINGKSNYLKEEVNHDLIKDFINYTYQIGSEIEK